jgi:hypothetical protein
LKDDTDQHKENKRRAATRKRVAKHRSPKRKGWATTYLDYTDTLAAAMVRWHWLPNKETHSKAEIRQAASKGLAEAAEQDAAEIRCNALRCPRCGHLML